MINILFDVADLPETELEDANQKLGVYQNKFTALTESRDYSAPESSILLPDDEAVIDVVTGLVGSFDTKKLKLIVVVGIGGSNLGSKAVYDARFGAFDGLDIDHAPRILFAETTSATWLEHFKLAVKQLSVPEEVAVLFISKSGTTTETVANFEVVTGIVTEKIGDISEQTIAITDQDSALWHAAEKHGWKRASIPAQVGGRYSVLSAVGLIPLALAGFNVNEFRVGAVDARTAALAQKSEVSQSAALLAFSATHGLTIHNMFLFNPELESVGKWYRQLMGESLGKKHDRDGKEVSVGLTPIVSIGSTDLHSVGQLYFEGPKDKFTSFVLAKESPEAPIPAQRFVPELAPLITGKSVRDIQQAIYQGVTAAYHQAKLPFRAIELPDLSERSLGALMQTAMIEMMFTAELMNVNAFDQPGVEAYKVETKRILEG